MNQSLIIFLLGISCGVWQWLAPPRVMDSSQQESSHQWPSSFEGKPLTPLPMTAMEREFGKNFPGAIGNFRCDNAQVILRHVTHATRKLHPAADCLRASGHHIDPVKIHTDGDGHHWAGCYASRAGQRYFLRERIVQLNDESVEWTDVSSWYWQAQMAPGSGPWLSITVICKE